jgi:Zn-dependent peptidase ImmA (M78 family)/transcriptional regulator with XRE-family HTH domain
MTSSDIKISTADAAQLFAGSRLALARHLSGLRKTDLAGLIDKTPTAIAAYETGRSRPSSSTVAALCVALGVEPSFFLPTTGTAEASHTRLEPNFRSLRSTTQLARDQASAYGALVRDLISVFERHVELPEVAITTEMRSDIASEKTTAAEAAQEIRQQWGLGTAPIKHVLRLAENRGVVCAFSPFQVAAVDAYSFDTKVRPVIILNTLKDDYYRQRFDLAHEVGHLVMHADSDPGNNIAERQAHSFAAEFLLPEDEISKQLPRRPFWPALQELKEYWGVSMQALLYRGRELKIYRDVTYRNAMVHMSKNGWRRKEPGTRPAVEQTSLLPRALSLIEDAGISAEQLAAQSRIPINLFRVITARSLELVGSSESPKSTNHVATVKPESTIQSLLLKTLER